MRIRAEVADEKFIKISDAAVSARVDNAFGPRRRCPFEANIEGGFEGYVAAFNPEEDGLYRVEVGASKRGKQAAALATAQTSL